jgi:peptidoglycan hydrolase-like protein with peptidoglycan-binding domain
VAFAVDGRPTVVLFGGEAAYREQNDDVDDGPDVAQLEENLAALGYTDGGTLVVDEHFAAATADAVEAWQTAMGVEATGVVELGDVVFVPGAVTVVSTATTVGDAVQPGARLLDVTGGALLAVADVPVARSDEVAAGMPTRVTLADDSVVSGTVREVAGAATRAEGAEVTESVVQVTVQLDATESPGAVEQADVDVEVTLAASEDALVVPLGAIVDGGDGRPAVLLAGSPSQPVAIEAGLSADGYVEVVGGTLAEGDVVLLPAGA